MLTSIAKYAVKSLKSLVFDVSGRLVLLIKPDKDMHI